MPPASGVQGIAPNPDGGWGFGFLLGNDYERKKNKLRQELQVDYKHYVATKKDLKPRDPGPQPEGLSLPIDEKISVQEKLRAERNKEYNFFLQQQSQIRRLRRGTPSIISKHDQIQASDARRISSSPSPLHIDVHNAHPPPREHTAPRRDAATLTELVDNGKMDNSGYPRRRRWQLNRLRRPWSSEEELSTDREEELEFRHRRRRDRYTPEPEYREGRRTRKHRANRAPQEIKEVEAPSVHDQNNSEWVVKSDLQRPDSMRMAARSRSATSKNKTEFATGLMIGATEEQTASQLRKERYKQDLLKQIAEQQTNKIREKKLELRVAATGATDPEKEPDRIKQFGAVNRQHDSRTRDVPYKPGIDLEASGRDPNPRPKKDKPTEDTEQRGRARKPHMDYSTVLSQLAEKETVPGSRTLDYFSEDYHKEFSNTLGEVAVSRVAAVPPPIPPTVTNNYKTPYDAAYHYYGTRNPLDPDLPYNQDGPPEGLQRSGNFHSAHQRPAHLRPGGRAEAADQHVPLHVGELPADDTKQKRENALIYQEALRQQIKEREERKRREKEEKERYDAKIEAEMMAYNPWGKSGGGAPIKDQKGNLVSDLNQMHRSNEETYRNPVSGNSGQVQSFLMGDGHTPRGEARAQLSHRLSGFSEKPTPQQLQMQNQYKEDLRRQIEENKRKQEEERERMRAEEEKEERRLADERARMQREYEKEQRKEKKVEHSLENQSWTREIKTQRKREEKRVSQDEEIKKKVPESARSSEEKKEQFSYKREPSPPIPTLQRKQTDHVASRPPSAVSQLSSRTERSVTAPHYRADSAKIQSQDGQQEVIRELSALRRYLRTEQRQLEAQMSQTDRQESQEPPPNRPRGRPRVDAFESAHERAAKPSARRPSSGVNMENIREFNQLKYRDTASREEVRHMYPDPPTDAHSLDIQQQALLREQQRKIRLMRRGEAHECLDEHLSSHRPRNEPGRFIHRGSVLPSESAFIDIYGGDACEERVHEQRRLQASAERWQRTAPRRRHDEPVGSLDQNNRNIQADAQSLQSETSLNFESEVPQRAANQNSTKRQNTGRHSRRSEVLPGDEVDVSSLRSALERRVSVDTVATEPWLRPGTSDTVKRSSSRTDAPPWLTHRVA